MGFHLMFERRQHRLPTLVGHCQQPRVPVKVFRVGGATQLQSIDGRATTIVGYRASMFVEC